MRLLIGTDIGTQGTKTVLYTAEGVPLAEAYLASRLLEPEPGFVEEDPEDQLDSVLSTVRTCLDDSGVDPADVAGLALAGQMAGVIGVNSEGIAITPYDSWLDRRCASYLEHLRPDADLILRQSGHAPSFNHAPKLLWWKHEHPDTYALIRAFVQPGAYVAMRLGGLDASKAFIDPTYLHFSGFADNQSLAWDRALCARHGIDPAKLPRILASDTIVATVSIPMGARSGLRAGTPIVAGCGDTAASFLACGATEPGMCVDVSGTASVFAAATADFRPDTISGLLGCGRSAIPGRWHSYAYINGGGRNVEWFAQTVMAGRPPLADLDVLAGKTSDDTELPYFVPHLGGRVTPPQPHLRGSWVGLNWSTDAGMLFRALLESVALEYSLYRDALTALQTDFTVTEVRITGGGVHCAAWNQLKADRLQAPVVALEGGGAPVGAALLAGLATGAVPALQPALASWVRLGRTFAPDPAAAALSCKRSRQYARLLAAMDGWSKTEDSAL